MSATAQPNPGGLRFRAITVTAANGETRKAWLAGCSCGCETFAAYMLEGQNHHHLQCCKCGASYCPRGGCAHG